MRSIVFAVLLLVVAPLHAADWRVFAGGYTSRWKTIGLHGHDQPPCLSFRPTHDCNSTDFTRGNLDDSIGFRAGRERDFARFGRLHLLGGAEGSLSYTEYNLSQNDFGLVTASVFGGAEADLWGVRIGGRYGIGPYGTTDQQQAGFMSYSELAVTFPLRAGAAVRFSERNVDTLSRKSGMPPESNRRSPSSRELAVMLVQSPEFSGKAAWEFGAGVGWTKPGHGIGSDRALRATGVTRLSASRSISKGHMALEISSTATAHESIRSTVFNGYGGNYRSKTIDSVGVGLMRAFDLTHYFGVRVSSGLELADWRDQHQLLTRDGRELAAGVEHAFTAGVGFRVKVGQHLAIDTLVQQVYWHTIDLGEARVTFGIAATR